MPTFADFLHAHDNHACDVPLDVKVGDQNRQPLLSVNDSPCNHGTVQSNPTQAWQIDISVMPPESEPQPENGGDQIRTPRQDRNARCLMTDPYGQHLGNGHDHREYGHSPQHATELCIRVGLSSQNVRRIVNHLAFLRIAMFRLLNLARRQRRAVLQRDQRVLEDAHGAWKRRHNHGDPQLARSQNRRCGLRILAPVRHRSRITSPRGREQQISASPFAGGSSGSGSYSTSPAISAVSQVWQTPVRQDHRTGTSHASASSSRLWYFTSQGKVTPLRAKDTCGPNPAGPAGKCGACVSAFIPGVMASSVPNISV